MDAYQQKATQIIRESIKNAVFIDEKAWNPFEGHEFDTTINENALSKELYSRFKGEGISLDVHRFEKGQEDLDLNDSLKRYLFKERDLVLLDWDLVEDDLNVSSLKLLNDVIQQPHIHFCVIYTESPNFDSIISRIFSYFFEFSSEVINRVKELLDYASDNDEFKGIVNSISLTDSTTVLIHRFNNFDKSILKSVNNIMQASFPECIYAIKLAFDDGLPKSNSGYSYKKNILFYDNNETTLAIENTIVTILRKEDNKPANLINNFSRHITSDKSKSFFKILGLNMQNEFAKQGAFVSPDILNISLDTFLYHKVQMEKKETSFVGFIKDILLENARLNLSSSQLSIIDSLGLDEIALTPDKHQIAVINSFYNGVRFSGNKNVGFGDIFIGSNNLYYLCITALCDTMVRGGESNIDFKYFFTSGSKISLDEGFEKGDGGYISYIGSVCISWAPGPYVKPFQIFIPEPQIRDGKLTVRDWKKEGPTLIELTYLFTLKQNYAQRIANHAFIHPVRVGVDFASVEDMTKKK